ncbi:carbohydrate ABC transporter permease [Clostridium tertium]|uniref:carbohydrate ABC transporter permease n=1 Tax=Clostridium tertium TaxID=1559 RepID=UPI00189D5106|nr:carbohydrate ABC transporter permease [Clostridium tertium]MDB1946556.1 carbohydrate ABC transporter permease [Clostridium tertium]
MKKKLNIKTILVIVATIIILGISLFPYFYMIIQSLAPWDQTDKVFIPSGITLKSYEYLLGGSGGASAGMWIKALLNSFIVSAPTAIVSVLVGLLVGYSVSKMKNFRGEKLVMNSLLFQIFFPVIILLVPRYMISKPLTNTYLGMILPLSVSIWGIFMYINYLKSLPDAVFEAARIDGASELKILWHIAFPVTKSVTTIVFLSTFMTRWSELMWDMLISPKINMQTLNVLISTQFKPMGNLPGPMYAASVILTLPIVIMFLCFSKYFKEGINFMLK